MLKVTMLLKNYDRLETGGGDFQSKVIGMLVVFLGHKILILVFFRVFWKFLCKNEILVSFRVCSFSISSKNESFQKVFSKLDKIVLQTVNRLFKLTDFLSRFI